ncbi:hypothetical protein AAVH_12529 [Aphelenchoides avenae]|nr:hypothetical protein AAVH_12529 [Aphelenchus avenae]
MMRKLIVLMVIGDSFVANAESQFTSTTSLYCRVKCGPDTWFGYHDTWLKYVECDVKFPFNDGLYCVETPQPWIASAVVIIVLLAFSACICRFCCGGAQTTADRTLKSRSITS